MGKPRRLPVILVVSHPKIRTMMAETPRFQLFSLCAILLAVTFAQVARKSTYTFPFISYGMYTQIPDMEVATFVRCEAELQGGQQILLNPTRIIPSLRNGRAVTKLGRLTSADRQEQLSHFVRGMASIYNRSADDNPIVIVRIMRGSFNFDDFEGESSMLRDGRLSGLRGMRR